MDRLWQFVQHHWFLSVAFIIVLIAVLVLELLTKREGVSQIAIAKLTDLVNRENGVVVDLRGRENYKSGHIVGAINIAAADVDRQINKLNKYQNQPLILIDNNGQQALKVVQLLRNKGFEKVYMLNGGMAAWNKEGLPLIKGD